MDQRYTSKDKQTLLVYLSLATSVTALCVSLFAVPLLYTQLHQPCQCIQETNIQQDLSQKLNTSLEKDQPQQTQAARVRRDVPSNGNQDVPGDFDARGQVPGQTKSRPSYNYYQNYYQPYFYRSVREHLSFLDVRTRDISNQISRASQWRIKGPRGPPGIPGIPGRDGKNGVPGVNGMDGMRGHDGRTGNPGRIGPAGRKGDPGLLGEPGFPGERGQKGEVGLPGNKGTNGQQGLQGVPGDPGTRGRRGNPGVNGVDGVKGEKGTKGDTICVRDEGYSITSTSCESLSHLRTGGGGVTYYRWGRTSCPAGGSSTVYSGQGASTWNSNSRGGPPHLCIPEEPMKDPVDHAYNYQLPEEEKLFLNKLPSISKKYNSVQLHGTNYFLPCAACYVSKRNALMVVPGQMSCPDRWKREYFGYLVQRVNNQEQVGEICLDSTSDDVLQYSDILTPIKADCESIPCPPYPQQNFISCAVCSK